MFECPNCGDNLKFDIPSQQLRCPSCSSKYDPYRFEHKTSDAVEEQDFEATIFTCPQCGGEILSTDDAAAGFCSFCGASTILYSRISHEKRPNYIIPFQKTKEDCKQAYSTLMKHAIFAPKELKDPTHIDSFRGIYMPYWSFYVTQKGPVGYRAQRSYRHGNYIITDHYQLEGEMDAYYKGLSYDASSSFSDNISEALAPYDVKGMKAFTPSYLSGFYADTANVDSEVYRPDAEDAAYQESLSAMMRTAPFSQYAMNSSENAAMTPASFHTRTVRTDSSMFPVWFLSYRNGDRVAYAAVNGQTGKVVTDLPVDRKKYVIGSLLLAIPLFLLLNLFFTMQPTTLLTFTALFALLTTGIFAAEVRQIARKEAGEDDRGLLFRKNPEKLAEINSRKRNAKASKTAKKTSNKGIAYTIVIIMIAFTFGAPLLSVFLEILHFPGILWIAIMAAAIVIAVLAFSRLGRVPDGHRKIAGFLFALAAIFLSAIIKLINPVSDLFYYAGAILVLAAVCTTLLDIISYYNVLATRRLPQFDKQGGDDRA